MDTTCGRTCGSVYLVVAVTVQDLEIIESIIVVLSIAMMHLNPTIPSKD